MATSESVTGGSDGDCGGRSRVAIVFEWIARFNEGGSSASFSLSKPGFGLPSSSAAAPRSGAEVGPGEALGAVVTIIEQWDSGKDGERSDRVMGECEDSSRPVGRILSRSGLEGAEDGGLGGSEGVRRSGLCWRETAAGGEVEEGGGADVEVSGVGLGIVIPEVTMSRIAPAVAESGEVTGMRRLPVVVW